MIRIAAYRQSLHPRSEWKWVNLVRKSSAREKLGFGDYYTDVEFSIFTTFSHFPALSLFFENSTSRRKPGKTFDEKFFPSPTPAWSENIFSPKLKIIYAKIDLAPSRWESIKEEFAQWWFSFVGAIWIFSFIKALIVFLKLERAAVVSERFNEIYLFHCRCLSGQ